MSLSERFRIKRAYSDFAFFNDQMLYPPPVFEKAPMHNEWEALLQDAYGKYHKIELLSGRSSAKSERVTINYPSWMLGRNHELRISLVSTPASKAEAFLSKITTRIEEDEFYKKVFGNLKPVNPKLWRTDAITIKRKFIGKDPSISAVGTMGQAVSKRSDLIIIDDPLDSENTKTQYQREGMIKWFNEALDPILEPTGLMIVILTPWHEGDLSQYLMKQQGWIVMKYPAIPKPELNLDTWLKTDDPQLTAWPEKYGYPVTVVDHNANPVLDEDGKPISISFLRSKYNANVDSFMSQYMIDPFSVTGAMFDVGWIKYFSPAEFELIRKNCLLYQGWDLSVTVTERSDYTACATVAHDVTSNTVYILEVYRDKINPLEQFTMVKLKFDQWSAVAPIQQVTIEADQYQESLAMGLVVATTMPVIGSKSRGKRKIDRIGLLGPHFRNGRLRVSELMRDGEFVYEYKRFPRAEKNDQLDALQKACEPILGQTGGGPISIAEIGVREIRGVERMIVGAI